MTFLPTLIDYGIIGILLIMSIISVAVAMERWMFIRRTDPASYNNKKELELVLTKRLHLIATIGSNAPYVGLLGTVLGIMLTFYTVGEKGYIDTKKIMTGLALALKATAVGLLVAIPSIIFYNLLVRRVKEKIYQWEIINSDKKDIS